MKHLVRFPTDRRSAARLVADSGLLLLLFLVLLSFAISFLGWVLGDPSAETVLYYPRSSGTGLAGELRGVPRTWGREARARAIAEDFLLGPADSGLAPVFDRATRLESCIYRGGVLYLDLAPEAALIGSTAAGLGIAALEASLRGALPGPLRIVVALGGRQVSPPPEALPAAPER